MNTHGRISATEAAGVAPEHAIEAESLEGIELQFAGGPAARFRLLWDQAPQTCAVMAALFPATCECFHAIYSGTMVAFLLEPTITAPIENATTCVLPGDLLFYHYAPGETHGHLNAVSEIYWSYDRYARPTMTAQFIPLAGNVFGTFDGSNDAWTKFAEFSKRLRFDGTSLVEVRPYGGSAPSDPSGVSSE